MEINLWTESIDWLNIIVNVIVLVGVPLIGAALLAIGGATLVKTVKAVLRALSFLVDEPTDAIIVELSDLVGIDRLQLVEALKRVLAELDAMPEEVNVGEAVK